MWVFLNDAMLSIVESDRDPTKFAIRARKAVDLVAAFPDCDPIPASKGQDYAWRIFVDKDEVEAMLVKRLWEVDYTNFKASVRDEARHDFYLAVWTKALAFQNGFWDRLKRGHRPRRPHG